MWSLAVRWNTIPAPSVARHTCSRFTTSAGITSTPGPKAASGGRRASARTRLPPRSTPRVDALRRGQQRGQQPLQVPPLVVGNEGDGNVKHPSHDPNLVEAKASAGHAELFSGDKEQGVAGSADEGAKAGLVPLASGVGAVAAASPFLRPSLRQRRGPVGRVHLRSRSHSGFATGPTRREERRLCPPSSLASALRWPRSS